ncbi:sigma-70 family RNA polymerase sigma factor [Reichenbachiella carrageenanivorans]|uniref:Sigma-70 family RNA polymerase sigma factor n=1 Tax=Reichenbachiella carrageenanivorans TaxID=2979869 RepID=A0ABY6D129_9BACT|nr:sigma-70 family RNA polymerase sigma factor [Reichenbachiella carrageenanivorans]UXX79877.1 sigma-70 family RNA polymerase sigma factor [Reichenbachiella carrageenanivorans]
MKKQQRESNGYEGLEDVALWALVAKSDLKALAYIYEKQYTNLYYFGLSCSKDEGLTEDAIQDLFIKVWDKRTSIHIKLSIKSYLISALRRIIIDKLTAQKKVLSVDGEFPEGFEPSLSVQDLMISEELDEERRGQIEHALSLLTKKQREMIYLRFFQEMSYDEIAESLKIRNQSVRNCIYEAMKIMKGSLSIILLVLGGLAHW